MKSWKSSTRATSRSSLSRAATSAAEAAALVLLGVLGAQPSAIAASAQATVIHDFGVAMNAGEFPVSTLIPATDGNLYGVTSAGGAIGAGAIFRLSPDGSVTTVYSFGTANYPLDDDGRWPNGDLLAHADGSLYGTTRLGGAFNHGTVYQLPLVGIYKRLYDFGGSASDGANPQAGLAQGTDGLLYGTTVRGLGNSRDGTIFRISTSGSYSQVYAFGASGMDGAWPYGGLTAGHDGTFYGTTFFGAPRVGEEGGAGTVFRYSPGASAARIYEFNTTGTCTSDGAGPDSPMILGADGNLYGTTRDGGAHGMGSVFKATPAGAVSLLYSFGSIDKDGREPVGKLLELADGTFIGATRFGGVHESEDSYGGTVFMLEPDGTYTRLHSFGSTATDGQLLNAGPTRGSDGFFYGTTTAGGSTANRPNYTGSGTVYRLAIDPSGSATTFQSAPSVCPTGNPNPPGGGGTAGGSGGALSLPWMLVLGLAGLRGPRRLVRSGCGDGT